MDNQQNIWKDEILKRGHLVGRPFSLCIALHVWHLDVSPSFIPDKQVFGLDINSREMSFVGSTWQTGQGPVVKRSAIKSLVPGKIK
jgi:hypothetical protein